MGTIYGKPGESRWSVGGKIYRSASRETLMAIPTSQPALQGLEEWDDEELRRGRRRDKNGKLTGRPPRVIPAECHRELTRRIMGDVGAKLRDELLASVEQLTLIAAGKVYAKPNQVQAITAHIERVLGKPKETVELQGEVPRWLRAIDDIVGEADQLPSGEVVDVTRTEDLSEDDVWEDEDEAV